MSLAGPSMRSVRLLLEQHGALFAFVQEVIEHLDRQFADENRKR